MNVENFAVVLVGMIENRSVLQPPLRAIQMLLGSFRLKIILCSILHLQFSSSVHEFLDEYFYWSGDLHCYQLRLMVLTLCVRQYHSISLSCEYSNSALSVE